MGEESSAGGAAGKSAGGGGGDDPRPSPTAETYNGKSCKGCLYYSSLLKSDARKPICFGISRSIPQVPRFIVGKSEMEATEDGCNLSDFKYACVGYSVFLDHKDKSTDKGENQAELPFCAGIELLVDRRTSNASHIPAHVHKEENYESDQFPVLVDATPHPQPQAYKPAHSPAEEFFSRFTRNAGLVASGVARNLNKVGNYIKENIDGILYPYRRRPK